MEVLEVRELGVGGRAPVGIRNRGKGEQVGETSFENYVGL
jgi:hypothetical protein